MTAQRLIAPTPVVKAVLVALSERDETAEPCRDTKGRIEPDTDLRDTENVPLTDDIQTYFEREVLPHVPDAWIDHTKTKIGYEIPFTRHFYKHVPPRELEEIDADLNLLISVRPVEQEVPRVEVNVLFVLVVACRCESGPGSCQEAR